MVHDVVELEGVRDVVEEQPRPSERPRIGVRQRAQAPVLAAALLARPLAEGVGALEQRSATGGVGRGAGDVRREILA